MKYKKKYKKIAVENMVITIYYESDNKDELNVYFKVDGKTAVLTPHQVDYICQEWIKERPDFGKDTGNYKKERSEVELL